MANGVWTDSINGNQTGKFSVNRLTKPNEYKSLNRFHLKNIARNS